MEFILILIVVFFLGKHLLFNVKINTVIFAIFSIIALTLNNPLIPVSGLSIILLIINLVDCIVDFIIADKYYEDISDEIDKRYALKSSSIVILLLLGWFVWDKNLIGILVPRVIFLCIVFPLEYLGVKNDVYDKMLIGYPLPYSRWQYSSSTKKSFHYDKLVKKLYNNGQLVTNFEVVVEEAKVSKNKLAKNYPKNILERIVYWKDKEGREEIKKMEKALDDLTLIRRTAYVSSAFYEHYSKKIAKVLEAKNKTFSPWKIKEFIELKELNLMVKCGRSQNVEWSEYFIIKCLKELVKDGTITDANISDEPLNNHAFGLPKSITSFNASDDPLLALDD